MDILALPDGQSKGCGIMDFVSVEGAKPVLTLNDSELREYCENGSGVGIIRSSQGML